MTNSVPPPPAAAGEGVGGLGVRALVRGLGWDVGLPLIAYYGLHLLGVADGPALLVATLAAAARVGWAAVRERRLNAFGAVMLLVFGLGLALATISGEPRFLLLKSSIVTAAVGLLFLGSLLVGRPLTLSASRSFGVTDAEEQYRTSPRARQVHRTCTAVWGTGLLVEALVRVPLVWLPPIPVAVALGTALVVATFAILITWNAWYLRRVQQEV